MEWPAIRKIRPLPGGGGSASIELVAVGDETLALKRQSPRHAMAERLFQQALRQAGLPSLRIVDHPELGPDEILLEYVEGSTTVGRALSLPSIERWAAALGKLHAVRSSRFVELGNASQLAETNWSDFLKRVVRTGLARQRQRKDGLDTAILDRIEAVLSSLDTFEPKNFALAHGDLHLNNALIRGDEIVLFDKAPDVWVAPAVFDLAVVYSEAFPGARYGKSAARASDHDRLAAFIFGYDSLPVDETIWLDHFVLVRSLSRYPNPFVPDLLSIIQAALLCCEVDPSRTSR
jgi:thiamine kinase-like enzyme